MNDMFNEHTYRENKKKQVQNEYAHNKFWFALCLHIIISGDIGSLMT